MLKLLPKTAEFWTIWFDDNDDVGRTTLLAIIEPCAVAGMFSFLRNGQVFRVLLCRHWMYFGGG